MEKNTRARARLEDMADMARVDNNDLLMTGDTQPFQNAVLERLDRIERHLSTGRYDITSDVNFQDANTPMSNATLSASPSPLRSRGSFAAHERPTKRMRQEKEEHDNEKASENDQLKKKLLEMTAERDKLEAKNAELVVQKHELERQNGIFRGACTAYESCRPSSSATRIEVLESQVEALEKKLHTVAPLAQAGADVRNRHFEKTRPLVTGIKNIARNQYVMQAGHSAAHDGDLLADLALIEAGYVPSNNQVYLDGFQHMYGISPADVPKHLPVLYRKLLNVRATLNSVEAHQDGPGTQTYLREEFSKDYQELLDICLKVLPKCHDPEVLQSLDNNLEYQSKLKNLETQVGVISRKERTAMKDRAELRNQKQKRPSFVDSNPDVDSLDYGKP